jgi:hypothetical protein
MMQKIAQATFAPPVISRRPARLIHARTTAMGWRKQTRISSSFFMPEIYPHTRIHTSIRSPDWEQREDAWLRTA